MNDFNKLINTKRETINQYLSSNIQRLSEKVIELWDKPADELDQNLFQALKYSKNCKSKLMYVIDTDGQQISSNINESNIDTTYRGQKLSYRPYFEGIEEQNDFFLSEIYIDKNYHRPFMTAIHRLVDPKGKALGYFAADFDLVDLPVNDSFCDTTQQWMQIKGDPSIRSTLFLQTRTHSLLDQHIDEVMLVIENLMVERGIFHIELHFSSSRATLWDVRDPLRYHLHVLDEIINPKVCLAYANYAYPKGTLIEMSKVRPVLNTFKKLRQADDTIYLRSASLNIMNGLVGLNFSCDGSHYMQVDEFLEKEIDFWFGTSV